MNNKPVNRTRLYSRSGKISFFLFGFCFLLIVACNKKQYKISGNYYSPVYFIPDSSVFKANDYYLDGINTQIGFSDGMGIAGLTMQPLGKDAATEVLISNPTVMYFGGGTYLVYPGEHISVKLHKSDEYALFEVEDNPQRNAELSFLNRYNKMKVSLLSDSLAFVKYQKLRKASLNEIFQSISHIKEENIRLSVKNSLIFDSLALHGNVSDKFKKIARSYLSKQYISVVLGMYQSIFDDTLKAYRKYDSVIVDLRKEYAGINDIIALHPVSDPLVTIFEKSISKPLHQFTTQKDITRAYDTALKLFDGLSRDFLLSKVLYTAAQKRIEIPDAYLNNFDTACKENRYKTLIAKIRAQHTKNETAIEKMEGGNGLLAVDGKKLVDLKSVLDKNLGKLVLLDFWASWCAPCIAEFPYMEPLGKRYPQNKFSIIRISVDGATAQWQKYLLSRRIATANDYVFVNWHESSFVKEYNIHEIPRYMLIDKNGKMISDNAPRPSEKSLQELIDRNL